MIVVLGAKGSMGQRYQAILKHLNLTFVGLDKEHAIDVMAPVIQSASGVIVATPTNSHAWILDCLLKYKKPVLVEKPISTSLDVVKHVLTQYKKAEVPLQMVNQYRFLIDDEKAEGPTYYDYFRHGSDGIYWDCISIVALANGSVELQEKSPIWTCAINGKPLSLADMDQSYIDMINDWLAFPEQDLNEIYAYHEKVHDLSKT